MDGPSPPFSKRLRVRGSQCQCCFTEMSGVGTRGRASSRGPRFTCVEASRSPFSPAARLSSQSWDLLDLEDSQLCPAARSHPVEPAHPQPCDLPRGHTPRWRQTGPGLETLLGFQSPKADMNSSFCPPTPLQPPLSCAPPDPRSCQKHDKPRPPTTPHSRGPSLSTPAAFLPHPLRTCSPAPSPPGHTQASHTSSPVLTCFRTWPQLQGGNLASVTLRQVLPRMDTPSPPPPLSPT